ncbi:MAG: DUF6596 domain-containing protein [Pseudonocardiaceae bacterium]
MPQVDGLANLPKPCDARRDARIDDTGKLVTLENQDRSRWDVGIQQRSLHDGSLLVCRGGTGSGPILGRSIRGVSWVPRVAGLKGCRRGRIVRSVRGRSGCRCVGRPWHAGRGVVR